MIYLLKKLQNLTIHYAELLHYLKICLNNILIAVR